MPASTETLKSLAADAAWIQANQNEGSEFVEPEAGRRAARRFLDAVADGAVQAADAWQFVCVGLHHWNPNEDPRLRGFINEMTERAAGPRLTVNLTKAA